MNRNLEDKGQKQSRWPLIISAVIIISIIASYFVIPAVNDFFREAYDTLTSQDEERISAWVGKLGFWGPFFIILAMVLQMFLIVVPSPLLMLVSILAYGPIWGSVIAIAAVFTASTVGFLIGKYLGMVTIYKLIGEKKEKQLEYYVYRYGFWAVFVTRLAPVLSNDAISFVGGIIGMRYRYFILATLAGIIPLTVLLAWFGENNQRLKNGLIWVSALSLAFLVVYIFFDRKRAARERKNSA